MKKFAVAIAILSISVLASCGGGSPEDVAQKFGKAMLEGDVETAQDISTENAAKLMPLIIGMMSNKFGEMSDEEKEEALAELATMECDVEDEKAKCGPKGKSKSLELKKVDGDWKVDFNKQGRGQG